VTVITYSPTRSTTRISTARYRGPVGLNPFRSHVSRRTDALVVGAAFLVILALVLWALFGG
jgi:hypothetical protein